MSGDDKKIFVDEDWKAQVQREREEAAQRAQAAEPAGAAPGAPGVDAFDDSLDEGELPEASFMTLVGSLATQAMLALGVIAPPGAKEVMVDLLHAKYSIDLLAMLREKTAGNLTPEESAELTQAVAELQHVFVARAQQIQEAEMKQAGVDITNIRGDRA